MKGMDIPDASYEALLRKVRAWVEATTPYEYNWTDIQLVCYAMQHLVNEIESGKASSLLNTEKGWIQYCTAAKLSQSNR